MKISAYLTELEQGLLSYQHEVFQNNLDTYVLHYYEKYNNCVFVYAFCIMKINLYVKMTDVFTI